VTSTVIYISNCQLTDKVSADWHIDFLIERSVAVEYWDIVALVREQHAERDAQNPDWLRRLRSFAEVESLLRRPDYRRALYVMLLTYGGKATRIFRLLSKYDCRMVSFASGMLPSDPAFTWRKIIAWLATPDRLLREIIGRFRASALRKLNLVRPFAVTFAAGNVALRTPHHSLRVVPINFFDYDRYVKLQASATPRILRDRYAVFLDINLPYHSDLTLTGYRHIDAAEYFRSMGRFFGLLEQAHGLRIVIAAHPRASYDPGVFGGRRLLRLHTAELVRDAEFVLSHTSTAMSYAVLFAKPIIFIYTRGMAEAYEHWFVRQIRCFADYLGAPNYNVDEIDDPGQVCVRPLSSSDYQRYKYDFLTSHASERTPTEEIVWRELTSQ